MQNFMISIRRKTGGYKREETRNACIILRLEITWRQLWILDKYFVIVWVGLTWFRIGSNHGLL